LGYDDNSSILGTDFIRIGKIKIKTSITIAGNTMNNIAHPLSWLKFPHNVIISEINIIGKYRIYVSHNKFLFFNKENRTIKQLRKTKTIIGTKDKADI